MWNWLLLVQFHNQFHNISSVWHNRLLLLCEIVSPKFHILLQISQICICYQRTKNCLTSKVYFHYICICYFLIFNSIITIYTLIILELYWVKETTILCNYDKFKNLNPWMNDSSASIICGSPCLTGFSLLL
jgi:hypothetical protein